MKNYVLLLFTVAAIAVVLAGAHVRVWRVDCGAPTYCCRVWQLEWRPTAMLPGLGAALAFPSRNAVGWVCVGTYGQLAFSGCLDEEQGAYVEKHRP